MSIVAQDTFARANQSGWGMASDGHVWTVQQAGPALSIANNEGVASGAGTGSRGLVTLGAPGITDGEVVFRFSDSQLTTSQDIYALCRMADASNYYWLGFQWLNSTTFNLAIRKRVAATNTTLVTSAISVAPATFYWIRARVQGSTLFAKFWQDGQAEPAGWTLTTTDTSLTSGALWGLAPFTTAGQSLQVDSFALDNLVIVPSPGGAAVSDLARAAAAVLDAARHVAAVSDAPRGLAAVSDSRLA